MSKRSVQIFLVNNTPFTLTEYFEYICHGSWGAVTVNGAPAATLPNWSLPGQIGPNAIAQWSSQDAEFSIFTGTEAWVKYTCPQTTNPSDPTSELVYIHWDNPYAWSSGTVPIDFQTSVSDVSPPCGSGNSWPTSNPGTFSGGGGVPGSAPVTQLFGVSSSGTNPPSFDWGSSGAGPAWDVTFGWPVIVIQGLIDAESDINLQFTLGLRQIGSVEQSIRHFYDGSKGLRALCTQSNQASLKKLFGF